MKPVTSIHPRPRIRLAVVAAVTALVATLAGTLALTPSAHACGGFFCSSAAPVNQAAERIIFVDHVDGGVTAVVQILYQGPSERFSWILPVPTVPEVGVSSNMAFTRLQLATNPSYTLQTQVEGTCAEDDRVFSDGGVDTASAGADAGSDGGGVTVEVSGSVGPYDYDVISVDPELADPADVAVNWLETEGYDVTEVGPDLLRPYLDAGNLLVAFRLTTGSTTGEIRPVVLHYDEDVPCIPIRLTAVAANDDMGVLTWVFHEGRVVPTNYRSLVINEALINWFNPASTYNDVINRAADESGGRGFVTELAGPSDPYSETVFSPFESSDFDSYAAAVPELPGVDVINEASWRYAGFDGFLETIRETVPLPQDVTAEQLAACVSCYYSSGTEIEGFDPAAFLAALEENVIAPMEDAQELINEMPYMTRLYTTMSARDMTVDPLFELNPDLGDYSNIHTATRIIECSEDVMQFEAPWRVDLGNGLVVRGTGSTWPFSPTIDVDQPANVRIEQDSTEGDGAVITDNLSTIQQSLAVHNETIPVNEPGHAGDDGGACGCASSATPIPLEAGLVVAAWAVATIVRRRRTAR